MKLTILYDNTTDDARLIPDWGFACLVETEERRLLFDTGARGDILLSNMTVLGIHPQIIDGIFLSHDHWDHTGGLADMLKFIHVPVYAPASCKTAAGAPDVVWITHAQPVAKNLYSTGELKGVEQSLVIQKAGEVVVVAGCSHPGVPEILEAAAAFGRVTALVGGLHGFDEYEHLKGLRQVCPTHCTTHVREIAARFPEKYLPGGAGRVLSFF